MLPYPSVLWYLLLRAVRKGYHPSSCCVYVYADGVSLLSLSLLRSPIHIVAPPVAYESAVGTDIGTVGPLQALHAKARSL